MFLREIRRLLGPARVLEREEDRLCYAFDATGILHLPEVVVCPASVDQVVRLVRLAAEEGVPVTPRGAGTGYSGGAVPLGGGVVLAMERMNRILELRRADGVAVVEAGVVNGALQSASDQEGLFYPPDPASLEFSTLGGNIAECAGGPRGLKYGVTRDYVLGLEFVAPDGGVVRCGTLGDSSAGSYDLAGLLGGSEGTLGIITRAALRLLPKPATTRTLLLTFETRSRAAQAVVSLTSARVLPSVVELVDESCLAVVRSAGGSDLPFEGAHVLLVEVEGEVEEVEEAARRVHRAALEAGCSGARVASDEKERNEVWAMRRAISPALAKISPTKINEDVCVPRSQLASLVERIEALSKEHGLLIPTFGHAGDGNLHVNLMVGRPDSQETAKVERAVDALFDATLAAGGTLSGEHGIGITKARFLEREIGPVGVRVLRGIKRALDPAGGINPGKLAAVG